MLSPAETQRIQSEFHIPVDSSDPGTYWIISLDSDSLLPTDEELALLRSYQEFAIKRIYTESFVERLLKLALPKCAGHNTVIFRKGSHIEGADQHWFYRRISWVLGPTYVPFPSDRDYKGLTLRELLDRIENLVPQKWGKWKEKNKGIFSPAEK